MFAAPGATTADEQVLFELLKEVISFGSGLDRKKKTGQEGLCQKIDKQDNSRK
jgi:hypothetical protein